MKRALDASGSPVTTSWRTFMDNTDTFVLIDLFTITLLTLGWPRDGDGNGLTLRWANYAYDVPWQGNIYQGGLPYAGSPVHVPSPRIERGPLKTTIGTEVGTLELDLYMDGTELLPPADGNLGVTPQFKVAEAIASGLFEGAIVTAQRIYLSGHPPYPIKPSTFPFQGGKIDWGGQITDTTITRSKAVLTVSSAMVRTAIGLPRNVYQGTCPNTLYDLRCTLSRTGSFGGNAFQYTGAVHATPSANVVQVLPPATQPLEYFALGTIQFTSGVLAGMAFTIANQIGTGTFELLQNLPRLPAPGDTVVVQSGCDKSKATCIAKFGNYANFAGMPDVPPPDSSV